MKKIHDSQLLAAYVKQHDLQNYMDADILTMASLQSFQKEEHLIRTGTTSDYLYFLVEGSMMVYSYPSDTQNICIDFVTIATPLGEASSLWGLLPKSSVKAVTDCICVSIPLNQYRNTLQQDVRFLQNICQLLSYRLNSGINLANSLIEPVETILNVSYRHLLRTITNFRDAQILEKQKSYYRICDIQALEELAENLSHSAR